MTKGKITLYVDLVSPFTYLAFWMLKNSPTFQQTSFDCIPILLGGLHKQCNNTAPLFIKNKDKWINLERERWAAQFKIPLRPTRPPGFPISTVSVQRVLCAVQIYAPEKLVPAIEILYTALWNPTDKLVQIAPGRGSDGEDGFDIKKPEVIGGLLAMDNVLGRELAEKVTGAMTSKEVKDRLMANTQKSFEVGAFGLPWFECENARGQKEGFWGFDHIGQVVSFMELDWAADKARSKEAVRAVL